ncbi:MAG: CAP domain-containing protein [Eubacteriales bacterium]|nr:CAP domain-containing protein [Eubacteriales bacterium]
MRRLKTTFWGALLLVCLCLFPGAQPVKAASAKQLQITYTVTTYQNRAREALKQLNTYRAKNGLAALEMTADLENAAIQRAAELFVFFDHSRPDLSDFDSAAAAYTSLKSCLTTSECIAAGYSKAADALADWQKNAKSALLDADYTHAGIACIYIKGSYNEYYWALILQQQPESFKARAAADTAKAGKTKTVTVQIASGMYERADNSHQRFELRAADLRLKDKKTAQPVVYLYDRFEVKLGKCVPESLSYRSGSTSIFTVAADGTVTRKKAGEATLTISSSGLSAIQCSVTIGSGASSSANSSSNTVAVTAATISERVPDLSAKEASKATTLSVYVRGASGYVLYRSTTKTGSYSKAAEKATTKRWDYRLETDEITKTYYYKVRAYKNSNGRRVYSEYSAPVKVAP